MNSNTQSHSSSNPQLKNYIAGGAVALVGIALIIGFVLLKRKTTNGAVETESSPARLEEGNGKAKVFRFKKSIRKKDKIAEVNNPMSEIPKENLTLEIAQ